MSASRLAAVTARITVHVSCFGAMREYLPATAEGNRVALELGRRSSIGDAVDALGAPRRLVFSALVNGDRSSLTTELSEGDEITLMPPFSGGRDKELNHG